MFNHTHIRNGLSAALVLTFCIGASFQAQAASKGILSNVKFSLWGTSDVSISQHQDREERTTRKVASNCWYVNQWQETRHGKRVVSREQVCN